MEGIVKVSLYCPQEPWWNTCMRTVNKIGDPDDVTDSQFYENRLKGLKGKFLEMALASP